MQLQELFRAGRRYWVSSLVLLLCGLAGGFVYLVAAPPQYTARTSVFVAVEAGSTALELQQGSTYAENQVRSFAQMVTMPIVLTPVIGQLGLTVTPEHLAQSITTAIPTGTAIIEIDVVGADPASTAVLADAIGTQLLATVQQLSPQDGDGKETVEATVVSPAAVPTRPTSPRASVSLGAGLLAGLVLAVGQALARIRLDGRIVSEADLSETGCSVIGVIGYDRDEPHLPPVSAVQGSSRRAEAFRHLRTNLQFLSLDGARRVFVTTSSVSGEGKTSTAINVASTLADAGESVLLIDADLRRPSVAKRLGLEGAAGLTTAILGRARLTDLVQPMGTGNLHVLASGQLPPNPSELLGSEAMRELLREAADRYGTVIIDSPPLLPVTDAAVVIRQATGALIVAGSGEVTRQQLGAALDSVRHVSGVVLGLVLNKVRDERSSYHYAKGNYGEPDAQLTWARIRRTGARSAPVAPEQAVAYDDVSG